VLTRGVLTRGVLTPGESVPDEGTPSEGTPDEGVADGCAGTCPVVIACCTMKTSTAGTTFGPGGGLSPPARKTAPVRPSPPATCPRPVRPGRPARGLSLAAGRPQGEQPPGQRVAAGGIAQGVHPPLEQPERGRFPAAVLAPGQVSQHPFSLRIAQLAIDQRGQALAEVPFHDGVPSVAAGRPRWRGRRWSSAARSWARPRWMRLRTVPSLTPRVAAISS
jgi:hypothetical protein